MEWEDWILNLKFISLNPKTPQKHKNEKTKAVRAQAQDDLA